MRPHWLNTTEYPFQPHYFAVNGQHMHYVEEGKGEIILFVHGTPSWSFDFRHCINALCRDHRCIAVDHIGFGLSDKPSGYDYSTQNHSFTLEKFILEKNLHNITLVVHDFGGPIGLKVATDHPERFKRIVVMNSWLWSSETEPDFIRLKKILKSPLLPFLYRYLNFSPRFILPRSFGEKKLPSSLRKQYTAPFNGRDQRNGALAFARSLLNDQDWFENIWEQKAVLRNKPCLFVWGMKDPVIGPRFLEKFQTAFANVQTEKLATCGHFPQEEEPGRVIAAMHGFMEKETNPY